MRSIPRSLFLVTCVLVVGLIFAAPASAQTTVGSTTVTQTSEGFIVAWHDSVQTTATDTSQVFTMLGYITKPTSSYTVPAFYQIYPNPVAGVDSARITLEGSFDKQHWFPIDTLVNNSGTASYTQVQLDLNLIEAPYGRLKATGLGSNTTAVFRGGLSFTRRR
jgi:hypothetical protein